MFWQVKVFDECLDVLYQNLFFGAITFSLQEKKLVQSGTKFVPNFYTRIFSGDLEKGLLKFNLTDSVNRFS